MPNNARPRFKRCNKYQKHGLENAGLTQSVKNNHTLKYPKHMATQIVELNGKKYNVTIVPEHGERGLDVSELFSLLPSALSLVQAITAEINAAKDGQLVAVTVAKSIDKTLDFVAKTLSLADLPIGAAVVVNKIINYAKHFAADVVEIETVK